MSRNANRAMLSLLNMTNEMYRKNIEIRRITKTGALLLMSGLSKYDISNNVVSRCLESQKDDGGFIGNTDTIWNIKFLSFYPEYEEQKQRALKWLKEENGDEPGFGRSKRDMHRIPVTGLALYLLPELGDETVLNWLENLWKSEQNSLTYKAAYTLLAFMKCQYQPKDVMLVENTLDWLVNQQETSGGFGPWKGHPVGENVYCTAVALLALIEANDKKYNEAIERGYMYLCNTQLKSGVWPYHEIEDGASWGLWALTKAELYMENGL